MRNRQTAKTSKERYVVKWTADEIEQRFEGYDFTNELEHNLVNSLAFKPLVARVAR